MLDFAGADAMTAGDLRDGSELNSMKMLFGGRNLIPDSGESELSGDERAYGWRRSAFSVASSHHLMPKLEAVGVVGLPFLSA